MLGMTVYRKKWRFDRICFVWRGDKRYKIGMKTEMKIKMKIRIGMEVEMDQVSFSPYSSAFPPSPRHPPPCFLPFFTPLFPFYKIICLYLLFFYFLYCKLRFFFWTFVQVKIFITILQLLYFVAIYKIFTINAE